MSDRESLPAGRGDGDGGETASASAAMRPEPPGPWGLLGTFLWTAAIVVAGFFASILASITYMGLIRPPGKDADPQAFEKVMTADGDFVWVLWIFMFVLAGGVLALAVGLRRGYPAEDYLAFKTPSGRDLAIWTGALVLFIIASDGVLYLVGKHPIADWMVSIFETVRRLELMLIAILVLAPVLEEAVFRGFILKGVQAKLGNFWAVVFATVPWALIHTQYEWYYIIVALLLGALFAIARIKTGSLLTAIFLHMLTNAIAVVELYVFTQVLQ